jgi:hypothetical protein
VGGPVPGKRPGHGEVAGGRGAADLAAAGGEDGGKSFMTAF